MPGGFQRSRSPVVPEPGCTLELLGEDVKGIDVKIQNVKSDRRNFQGGPLELVSLKIPPGDSNVHSGWNIIDKSHCGRGQVT